MSRMETNKLDIHSLNSFYASAIKYKLTVSDRENNKTNMDDVSIRHGCPCFQLKHTGHNIRTEKIVKYEIVFGLGKD
jgi:hypothetical protein